MNNIRLSKRRIFTDEWLIVGVLTVVMIGFYGAQMSFGVFLKPIMEEFGWRRAMASGAMSTVSAISALGGVIAGRFTDKYGARMLIGIGGLAGGLGYLLMSQASSLWHLYLYFGFMVGISIASCWTPVIATVSRWFVEKRGLPLAITMSGITVGNMLLPPLSAYFTIGSGWRFTYTVMAIIVWGTAIPAVLLLGRNPPQRTEPLRGDINNPDKVEDKVAAARPREWAATQAVKTMSFWMLMVTGLASAAGYYFVSVHIVAYATDMGVAYTSAALILTFLGGASILGRLLLVPVSTKMGSRFTLFLLYALQAAALFLLMGATSPWMFFALVSVFGFGFGAGTVIRTSMIPEFFGLSSIGTMVGIVHIAWEAGGISGPVLAGYVFDLSGSYDIAFSAGGFLMIAGMAATCFLKAPTERSRSRK